MPINSYKLSRLQKGRRYRQAIPIREDVMITTTPISIPSPPRYTRKRATIIIAIKVGINPKNKPEMERTIDRASKKTPSLNVHGVKVKMIPKKRD